MVNADQERSRMWEESRRCASAIAAFQLQAALFPKGIHPDSLDKIRAAHQLILEVVRETGGYGPLR